ncbi:MAG: hypothetical protein IJB34_05065 [Clostridia bacterium]|nr:hypothetical protein [Clostridia bacterium]
MKKSKIHSTTGKERKASRKKEPSKLLSDAAMREAHTSGTKAYNERAKPTSCEVGRFWCRVKKSKIHSTTGKERKASRKKEPPKLLIEKRIVRAKRNRTVRYSHFRLFSRF